MADVSLYVPVISAASAILGASISPLTTVYQNSRVANRNRDERQDRALREACVDLLRAVGDLRNQVADNHEYPGGEEMGARLSQMRRYVTAAKVHAVSIALMAPRTLAEPAERLAEAAHRLAVTAAKNTDLAIRMSNRPPDFRELDARTADFSEEAVSYARRKQATVRARGPRVSRVRGRRAAAPPSDVPTTAADL